MKLKKIRALTAGIMTAAFCVLMNFSCSPEKPRSAFIIQMLGTVEIISSGSSRAASVNDVISNGEIISTGPGSFAAIQSGSDLVIRIQENSRVAAESLTGTASRALGIERGKIVSKIGKLKRGASFDIKTPTAVASVRGTEFSVSYEEGKSVLAVKTGKVSIAKVTQTEQPAEATAPELVGDGGAAEISAGETAVSTRPISKIETLEIERVSIIPVVNKTEKTGSEEYKSLIEETVNPIIEEDKKIEQEIKALERENTKMTLEEIKKKYERIDRVELYSGKIIEGVILSRGDNYKIMTSGGLVNVPANQVRKTQRVQ